jgi:hypothetical protein
MSDNSDTYPVLPKSYKGVYPFKLATTSFIYPDDYIPNIQMLGPYFDEIELLLFESKDIESCFPKSVVDELGCLSKELDIGYTIHLPTDVSISAGDDRLQFDAIECYKRTIDRMLPLAPSSFFLHVPYTEQDAKEPTVEKWCQRIRTNLLKLIDGTIDGSFVSIETLDYPLDYIEDIAVELNLSICIDVGHLIINGCDILKVFEKYSSMIASIHLHGVENNQDHLGLDRLAKRYRAQVMEILKNFEGILSLEVFSYLHLMPSLQTLEDWWNTSDKFGT